MAADRKAAEATASRQTNTIPAPSFRNFLNSPSHREEVLSIPGADTLSRNGSPLEAPFALFAQLKATHNSPRTWLLTSALSPLQIRLIRLLLAHGDYVVACLPPHEVEDELRSAEFRELVNECKSTRKDREGWKDRLRGCAVIGTVEELSTTPVTQNLVRDQFETLFFSQINFIKATLPTLREQHTGHIIHRRAHWHPGMPIYTAATWALEGYCDSLAYEIAPFNVKVTIVQPNKEIQSLTNKIIFAPPIPPSENDINMAPSTAVEPSTTEIISRYPKLPAAALDKLVMETVHALTAIGGHENPPARHIVGFEGAIAVKDKLKTVTEELEDFVEASIAVDIPQVGGSDIKEERTTSSPPRFPGRP
ncbi:unnamed protein product [Parascedosporium putredinis]|uniref:Uncharacterized protein n=1 Tax=Parascedosporium putredinis TaxID=1442378 RepID=A0A9P1H6D5_9PEZI|nr:unnamed protein product [Parascedosporium putredinis]CAI7998717.1 unnamed protein product [Parascedosporium putredinis]